MGLYFLPAFFAKQAMGKACEAERHGEKKRTPPKEKKMSIMSGTTERSSNLLHLFFSMIWVNLISQTNHFDLRE
jgi:hypothetical protein